MVFGFFQENIGAVVVFSIAMDGIWRRYFSDKRQDARDVKLRQLRKELRQRDERIELILRTILQNQHNQHLTVDEID